MKMNFNKIAKKAHGGDKEALTILVLEAPSGMMKGSSPEEFAKQAAGDESMCEKMASMDHMSKDAFSAYSDDVMDDRSGSDVKSDLMSLLENWTERDESTLAGQYYYDLKKVVDDHYKEEHNDKKENNDSEEHNSKDEEY
tara:strand:- start:2977 stop:3396 length:420 start_codon:yes stop_codon:yes gene_type:complete